MRDGLGKSVNGSDGDADDFAAGGNTVFHEQSGEHPVRDSELELGADSGGQSWDCGDGDDSFESMPAGNRYGVRNEFLSLQSLHFRDGDGGGGAGDRRELHARGGQREDYRNKGASAYGRIHGGIGDGGNSGSMERCVGK